MGDSSVLAPVHVGPSIQRSNHHDEREHGDEARHRPGIDTWMRNLQQFPEGFSHLEPNPIDVTDGDGRGPCRAAERLRSQSFGHTGLGDPTGVQHGACSGGGGIDIQLPVFGQQQHQIGVGDVVGRVCDLR